MFNKHFLWLFQNVSILTEPGTNHDASLFLRATSLSCRTIFTGRNRRFPCCIRPDQNTPGQTKAPFSPRNAEKRVQVNVFTWPCRNRHSPVCSPQALSNEKLRSAVLSEVLNGTNHLRSVRVLVVVLNPACSYHYYTTFQRYFQVFPISFLPIYLCELWCIFSFTSLRKAWGPGASAGASALPRYSPQSVILRL